jgi:hypothetical protein
MLTTTQVPDLLNTTGNTGDFQLGADVVLVQQSGDCRLLDFRRGTFYALDTIGTMMISLLLRRTREEAIEHVAGCYAVESTTVRSDMGDLLGRLTRMKLIRMNQPAAPRTSAAGGLSGLLCRLFASLALWCCRTPRPGLPGRFTVWLLLTWAWFSLRLFGLSTTAACWKKWQPVLGGEGDATETAAIDELDRMIRVSAASRIVFPMVCKERALAGYHLLRACLHVPAELVIGIELHPFRGHAWVECGERIVTDDREHCEPFTPIMRYN